MTFIKICGLSRHEDIEVVNELLPDLCGFIINYPKSHRSVTPAQARRLTGRLDREHITTVGVFVNSPLELIACMTSDNTIDIIQLHGDEGEAYIERLRRITNRPIIKAFTIRNAGDLNQALKSSADYILLDAGKGSGQTFNWDILTSGGSSVPDKLRNRKWFLAGGLNADNITDAIHRLDPYAVDLSSSVETDRVKDPEKIRQMIDLVREA